MTERTRRTTRGISGMVMATITEPIEGPFNATSAIAIRIDGIAIKASIMRMMIASAVRKKPAINPINTPTPIEAAAANNPISSEMRPPRIMREKRSRP
ncbi:hypothetical protein D9M68_927750 [compost metagenome]